MPKLCPKIILEGTRLTFKTRITSYNVCYTKLLRFVVQQSDQYVWLKKGELEFLLRPGENRNNFV